MEEACRLWREGVRDRVCSGNGSGLPYSRSLAGVGGRLDGVSDCSDGRGDIVRVDGDLRLCLICTDGGESSEHVVNLSGKEGDLLGWET